MSVGTDYSADVDPRHVQVLERGGAWVPANRLEDRDPQIVLTELGASSEDWQVRVWVEAEQLLGCQGSLDATRSRSRKDEAGIGIPFPQMDVHLDKPA